MRGEVLGDCSVSWWNNEDVMRRRAVDCTKGNWDNEERDLRNGDNDFLYHTLHFSSQLCEPSQPSLPFHIYFIDLIKYLQSLMIKLLVSSQGYEESGRLAIGLNKRVGKHDISELG